MLWLLMFLAVLGFFIYRADKNFKQKYGDHVDAEHLDATAASKPPEAVTLAEIAAQAQARQAVGESVRQAALPAQTQTPVAAVAMSLAAPKVAVERKLKASLLSPEEQLFYRTLAAALGAKWLVLCKLSLAQLLAASDTLVPTDDAYVDFVVCDAQDFSLLCGLMLNAPTKISSALADECQQAGLQLLEFSLQETYSEAVLRGRVLASLGHQAQPTSHADQAPPQQAHQSETAKDTAVTDIDGQKLCPKCQAAMVMRKARDGAQAGKLFWACCHYPDCKTILAV